MILREDDLEQSRSGLSSPPARRLAGPGHRGGNPRAALPRVKRENGRKQMGKGDTASAATLLGAAPAWRRKPWAASPGCGAASGSHCRSTRCTRPNPAISMGKSPRGANRSFDLKVGYLAYPDPHSQVGFWHGRCWYSFQRTPRARHCHSQPLPNHGTVNFLWVDSKLRRLASAFPLLPPFAAQHVNKDERHTPLPKEKETD